MSDNLDRTFQKLGLANFDRTNVAPFEKMEIKDASACRCASGYHSEMVNNLWGGEPSCRCVPNNQPTINGEIYMMPNGECRQLINGVVQTVICPSTNYGVTQNIFDELNNTIAKLFKQQQGTIAVGEINPNASSNFISENKGLIALGIAGFVAYSMFGKKPRPKSVNTSSEYKY